MTVTHCPHGWVLKEDICMECFSEISEGHVVCNLCSISGNLEWADDHLLVCAGIHGTEESSYEPALPF